MSLRVSSFKSFSAIRSASPEATSPENGSGWLDVPLHRLGAPASLPARSGIFHSAGKDAGAPRGIMQSGWRHWLLLLPWLITSTPLHAQTFPELTLQQAHETALRNHPRISVADLRALAARQAAAEARAGFFPNLSANVVAVGTD